MEITNKGGKVEEKLPITLPIKRNKTSRFIIPAIGMGNMATLKIQKDGLIVTSNYDKMISFGFVSIDSYWTEYKEHEDIVFLTFQPKEHVLNKHFDILRNYLFNLKHGNFNTFREEFVINKNIFVFVLNLHRNYSGIKDYIMRGQYSMVPLLYPNYEQFFFENGRKMSQYYVLMRSKEYRQKLEQNLDVVIDEKAELEDSPNVKLNETLEIKIDT